MFNKYKLVILLLLKEVQEISKRYRVKICLVGDYAVGKTSLRKRYLGQGFQNTYIETVGADFSVIEENIKGVPIEFTLWDLAGQQEWENLTNLYYSGSKGFLLVYDITRPSSLSNIMNWVEKIKEYVKEDVPAVLIANKIDLRGIAPESELSPNSGKQFTKKISQELSDGKLPVLFIETSAKTGENVSVGFRNLSEAIYDILV